MRSAVALARFLTIGAVVAATAHAARADDAQTDLRSAVADVRRALAGGEGTTWWEVGGRLATHAVRRDDDAVRRETVHLDEAVLRLRAGDGPWFARLDVDAEGSDARGPVREAWLGHTFGPRLVVRAGRVTQPLNSEWATPASVRPLPGMGFVSHLTARTGTGIAAESEWNCGALRYEASATCGHGHGLEGARHDSTRITGRFVGRPLQNVLHDARLREAANGLWIGVAAAWDDDADDPVRLETPLESTLVRSRGLRADRATTWLAELGWAWERWRVSVERAGTELEDVPGAAGAGAIDDAASAWSVHAAVSLTATTLGHDHGRWTRERAERLPHGDWELAARCSRAETDRLVVSGGVPRSGRAASATQTVSAALSWRPVEELRLALSAVRTVADDAVAAFGGGRRDTTVLLSLEVEF